MFYNLLNIALQLGKGMGVLPNPVSFMEDVEKLVLKYLESLFLTIYKVMQYLTIVLTLLLTSTAFYAILYNLMMPTKLHEKPIYFQYPSQRDVSSERDSISYRDISYNPYNHYNPYNPYKERGERENACTTCVNTFPSPFSPTDSNPLGSINTGSKATITKVTQRTTTTTSTNLQNLDDTEGVNSNSNSNSNNDNYLKTNTDNNTNDHNQNDKKKKETTFTYGNTKSKSTSTNNMNSNDMFDLNLGGENFYIYSYPSTTLDLLSKASQYQTTAFTRLPPVSSRILMPDRVYVFHIDMEVPDLSIYNSENRYGLWMVTVELLTVDDLLLAKSTRPMATRYVSPFLQTLRTFAFAPLYVFGWKHESQRLSVECFDYYQESPDFPLAKARVSLSSNNVYYYNAYLSISPQLNMIQYIMYHWFYTTAITVIVCSSVLLGVAWAFFLLYSQLELEETDENYTFPGQDQTNGGDYSLSSSQNVNMNHDLHMQPLNENPYANLNNPDLYDETSDLIGANEENFPPRSQNCDSNNHSKLHETREQETLQGEGGRDGGHYQHKMKERQENEKEEIQRRQRQKGRQEGNSPSLSSTSSTQNHENQQQRRSGSGNDNDESKNSGRGQFSTPTIIQNSQHPDDEDTLID